MFVLFRKTVILSPVTQKKNIMTLLYQSFNESVLSSPLVSMYGVLVFKDRNKLIQIVKWSGKLTGESKLSLCMSDSCSG